MRMTKAPYRTGEIVTLYFPADDLLAPASGVRARITDLYWEETEWGFGVEPLSEITTREHNLLVMSTLHVRDFA